MYEKEKKAKAPRKGMGVYSKMRADKIGTKFDKRHKHTVREKMTITHSFADASNEDFEKTGYYYELDEKATKVYEDAAKASIPKAKPKSKSKNK